MFAFPWLRQLQRRWFPRRTVRRAPVRWRMRLCLESLEDRLTPSTYTVTDASDTAGSANDVTLRYAISQAVSNHDPNAVIGFSSSLAGQTITLSLTDSNTSYGPTAFVVANAKITLDGSNAPGLVLDGHNALRLFAVTNTGSLTLEDLTVEGGLAQGGAGGNTTMFGGSGGGGAGLGGAVYEDGGAFTAEGVTFTNNTAQGGAGGSSSGFGDGYGTGGGGGLGVDGQSGPAGGAGGGTGGNGGTKKPNNTYYPGGLGGFGGGGGGGGYNQAGGGGGFGGGGGGGGDDDDGVGLSGSGGAGGAGGFGGGAGGQGRDDTSGGGGGGGAGLGGAVFGDGGTITLIDDTFATNTAQSGAGGTAGGGRGASGSGFGGAVFVRNSTLTAQFDTFSSNTAVQGGTDVYVLSDGSGSQATASLVDDILGQTDNSVSDFVANNINSGNAPDLSGSSHDLVRNNPIRNNPSSGGLPSSAVISSADPLLSVLANNSGPTDTMAITSSSPAFQAGKSISGVTTDQRGVTRPDTPSLGAFEPLAVPPPSPPSPPAATSIQFTSIQVIPNLLALNQTERIAVHLSGASVSTVTFTLGGHNVSASVDGKGNATASLTLPLLTTAFPQGLTAAFSGPGGVSSSVTATAFWNVLDALLPRVDSFAADGGQSVQSYLFNLPLLDFLYTSLGQLTKVVLGPNLRSWDYSSSGLLTVVRLDGVLPVLAALRTPQGQFLGALQLTVSADGTPVIETINAQGQVVSMQPL